MKGVEDFGSAPERLQASTAGIALLGWLNFRRGESCVRDGRAGLREWCRQTNKGVQHEASADARQEAIDGC